MEVKIMFGSNCNTASVPLVANIDGKVKDITVREGDMVESGQLLMYFE